MGDRPQTRLVIAVVLLTFQELLFVSHYLVSLQYHRKRKLFPRVAFLQSLVFPIFVAALGIILISVMFNGNDSNKACMAKIDDDIGGRGIRAAAWAQLGVLLFLALVGIFHTKTTGIKEFGASLTITHLSLVIALLFELQDLKATDAILGSMILDSQNSALSIPLVTKATLAARWQVWTIVPCQAFGLAVLGVLVHKFNHNHFKPQPSCGCVSVVWWGRLATTQDCTSGSEQTVFWLYYACRVLSVAHIGYQALVDTGAFHKAEKKNDRVMSKMFHPLSDSNSRLMEFLQRLLRISGNTWRFTEYPTTLSLTFLVSGVFAVASMSAAEAAMTKKGSFGRQSNEFSPGQIISVVAAIVGIIIGVFRFIRLFLKSDQPGIGHEGKWRRWFLTSSLTSL
ncbi:hypothetical protein CcaCcLH18_00606 [Colletotrichum camelliae]|nr:hypothetical protein CcaCcLH18_00606 [Colletotrichum camelliae]